MISFPYIGLINLTCEHYRKWKPKSSDTPLIDISVKVSDLLVYVRLPKYIPTYKHKSLLLRKIADIKDIE